MRPAAFASLFVLALVVPGLSATTLKGGKHAPAPEAAAPPGENPPWTVTGYGVTGDAARQAALKKAREKVLDYLARQNPPVRWQPDADWVQNLVEGGQPKQVEVDDPVLGKKVYEQTYRVELGHKQYREALEKDRQEIVVERQLLLARILAGIIALLVAVIGYLRLDEATKGYYTLWLRLGALTLVGGVAAVLLLIA
jgi:hypothetical protein